LASRLERIIGEQCVVLKTVVNDREHTERASGKMGVHEKRRSFYQGKKGPAQSILNISSEASEKASAKPSIDTLEWTRCIARSLSASRGTTEGTKGFQKLE
jgi:hypothetical protein